MNRKQFVKFHKDFVTKMNEVVAAKNADYNHGGDDQDAFANFKYAETNGIASVEQGFLVRMTDKMTRITSLTSGKNPQVKDESIKDTLMDLANYSILFAGYLESKGVPPLPVELAVPHDPTKVKYITIKDLAYLKSIEFKGSIFFTDQMEKLCGQRLKVEKWYSYLNYYETVTNGDVWCWDPDWIEKYEY